MLQNSLKFVRSSHKNVENIGKPSTDLCRERSIMTSPGWQFADDENVDYNWHDEMTDIAIKIICYAGIHAGFSHYYALARRTF